MKCGFFDCNNQVEGGKNHCQSCKEREEWRICSACRQPEPEENKHLSQGNSFLMNKLYYYFAAKMRDKAPSQFQPEFDPILSDLKLSEAEKKLIHQAEKAVLDFLTEKGGKQDNSNWFKICSVCKPELEKRMKDFTNQHPEIKSLWERIDKNQEKLKKIGEEIKQAIGKEEFKKIGEELEEEIGDNWRNYDGPTGPGNQGPNNDNSNGPNKPGQRDNNNSAQINQLQQEINGLKQEGDNSLPNKKQQPSKNGNSNLPLYLGLGAVGVVIIMLALFLVSAKKNKKNSD